MLMLSQRKSIDEKPVPDDQIRWVGTSFGLSRREIEMLCLLPHGRSAPYIAETEFISLNTVKTHIKRIYVKMDIHNREELLDIVYRKDTDDLN